MTPDELRRMDNDLCIIFEKGIKPVKANKYYYFKHKNVADTMRKLEISHNDIGEIQRGEWRKFNPYNPWKEDNTDKEVQNLQVESLDDLFDEEPAKEEEKSVATVATPMHSKKAVSSLDNMFEDVQTVSNSATTNTQEEEDSYDLQKELEAKFDELFGPMDDE